MESEQYDFRILCNKPSDNIGYVKKKKESRKKFSDFDHDR